MDMSRPTTDVMLTSCRWIDYARQGSSLCR